MYVTLYTVITSIKCSLWGTFGYGNTLLHIVTQELQKIFSLIVIVILSFILVFTKQLTTRHYTRNWTHTHRRTPTRKYKNSHSKQKTRVCYDDSGPRNSTRRSLLLLKYDYIRKLIWANINSPYSKGLFTAPSRHWWLRTLVTFRFLMKRDSSSRNWSRFLRFRSNSLRRVVSVVFSWWDTRDLDRMKCRRKHKITFSRSQISRKEIFSRDYCRR